VRDYRERSHYHRKRIGQQRYKVLAGAINRLLPFPQAALDIGCSCGALLGEIKAGHRVGIDTSMAAKGLFESLFPECRFELYDLEKDTHWLGHFDLLMCMEVPEHVANADNLLRLVNESASPAGAALVWSAAPPNQPGRGHVNTRPYRWWRKKLERLGWSLDEKATEQFANEVKGKVPEYYHDNTRIYRK